MIKEFALQCIITCYLKNRHLKKSCYSQNINACCYFKTFDKTRSPKKQAKTTIWLGVSDWRSKLWQTVWDIECETQETPAKVKRDILQPLSCVFLFLCVKLGVRLRVSRKRGKCGCGLWSSLVSNISEKLSMWRRKAHKTDPLRRQKAELELCGKIKHPCCLTSTFHCFIIRCVF